MKRIYTVLKRLLPYICIVLLLPISAFASGNLKNAELADAVNGVPESWNVLSYLSGGYSVSCENGIVTLDAEEGNDLRLCQLVEVEENASYLLSAEISTQGVTGGKGATLSIDNFSIDGCYIYSASVLGSSDWLTVTLPFLTGAGQKAVNVALRLGGYSEESRGTVRFRNVRFEQLNEPVAGAILLQEGGSVPQSGGAADKDRDEMREYFLRSVPHLFIVVSVALAVVLLFGVYRHREELTAKSMSERRRKQVFALMVFAGLVLRSFLCARWRGHDSDMSCWMGWGSYIANNGTRDFYTAAGHEWYDYPPGYMLILGALTRLLQALKISQGSQAGTFAYMLPAYAADIGIAFLLMDYAAEKGFNERWQLLLAGLSIFGPASVVLSGAWGQIDSILTFFLLISFLELIHGRRITAGALYGLAVIFKWQALIYGPVLAAAYLLTVRSKKDILDTVLGVIAALAVIFLVSLPFKGSQGAFWLIGRFLNASSGYDYASVEAYNFLALLGGNWANASNKLFLGISYKTFGTVSIIIAVLLSLFSQWRTAGRELRTGSGCEESGKMLFLASAFCMYAIFTFGHYMHERYVFPVVFLLLFAFIAFREPRLLFCALFLSCVLFLNECMAMFVVSEMASAVVRSGREHLAAVKTCSIAETAAFLYFFAVWLGLIFETGEEVAENA